MKLPYYQTNILFLYKINVLYLTDLNNWFNANSLHLNINKTSFIHFHNRQERKRKKVINSPSIPWGRYKAKPVCLTHFACPLDKS